MNYISVKMLFKRRNSGITGFIPAGKQGKRRAKALVSTLSSQGRIGVKLMKGTEKGQLSKRNDSST